MSNFSPSSAQLLRMQREQYRHDKRNHCDIQCLHKGERLKHYALHFSKYVGRLSRGYIEPKSPEQTIVDMTLVCLSAANTLAQKLGEWERPRRAALQLDAILILADAAGRFADAAEKFDHLEEVVMQARDANVDIFSWICHEVGARSIDIEADLAARRKQLAERAFYAQED